MTRYEILLGITPPEPIADLNSYDPNPRYRLFHEVGKQYQYYMGVDIGMREGHQTVCVICHITEENKIFVDGIERLEPKMSSLEVYRSYYNLAGYADDYTFNRGHDLRGALLFFLREKRLEFSRQSSLVFGEDFLERFLFSVEESQSADYPPIGGHSRNFWQDQNYSDMVDALARSVYLINTDLSRSSYRLEKPIITSRTSGGRSFTI